MGKPLAEKLQTNPVLAAMHSRGRTLFILIFTSASMFMLGWRYNSAQMTTVVRTESEITYRDNILELPETINMNTQREMQAPMRSLRGTILIFTIMRSGSSFVGELLRQNNDIFYMFEPLKIFKLDTYDAYRLIQKTGPGHVADLLRCNFKNALSEENLAANKNTSWKVRSFCPSMDEVSCRDLKSWELEGHCLKKKYVAIKEISLQNLDRALGLIQNGTKVIHLVRDPRGIISSMQKIHFKETDAEELYESVCARLQSQVEYANSSLLDVYKGYKLFRYEDFALRPFTESQRLYKYLNIEIPGSVTRWIQSSTKVQSMPNPDEEVHPLKYAFSTKRDSRDVASAWRRRLRWEQINAIQNKCGAMLKALGYRIFNNHEELRNETLHVVLKPGLPLWKDE